MESIVRSGMSHVCISLLRLFDLADQISWFGRKRDVKSHDDMQHFWGVNVRNTFNKWSPSLKGTGPSTKWTLLIAT